jgi:hypothetical protein
VCLCLIFVVVVCLNTNNNKFKPNKHTHFNIPWALCFLWGCYIILLYNWYCLFPFSHYKIPTIQHVLKYFSVQKALSILTRRDTFFFLLNECVCVVCYNNTCTTTDWKREREREEDIFLLSFCVCLFVCSLSKKKRRTKFKTHTKHNNKLPFLSKAFLPLFVSLNCIKADLFSYYQIRTKKGHFSQPFLPVLR